MSELVEPRGLRRHALLVLASFVASLAVGLLLLAAFDPEVQTLSAAELVERRDSARSFLAADYLFVALYAVLSPLAIRRFGRALGAGAAPRWIVLAAALLAVAGLFDAVENALLWSASDQVSDDTVQAAHAVAVPKLIFFAVATLLALAVNGVALRAVRAATSQASLGR